ncbi:MULTISPECIES: CotS family spore coat protein [Clostridium]|uniref:CotS family spore coat protein n=1 Tax=Clostridium TaxID=1485 RepID=UPI000824714A|nr:MULTISPECIES: CotS family spore coat protein [Clostridium]PJI09114.1 CotS family spore coat protein [Clostridium sp. CT7]
MSDVEINKILKENYDINVNEAKKIKNVYKIESGSEIYCLKCTHYDYGHVLFIVNAIDHLRKNGFTKIPKIIPTISRKEIIKFQNGYAYLTNWIDSRVCNFDNPVDLKMAAVALASLHKSSRNFIVTNDMNPRIGWFKWLETFKRRKDEILNFQKIICSKENKTEFDNLYMKLMKEETLKADKSINDIKKSQYVDKMQKEYRLKGFCHHDYAHHNILIDKEGEANIIDFDYCILDTHLHDLSSLLIRRMKNGFWDMRTALFILNAYNSIYAIENSDLPIMAAFMEFPQGYWQVGLQYYIEKQPWTEEFFMSKLYKIYKDKGERQEFLDKFMLLKYL